MKLDEYQRLIEQEKADKLAKRGRKTGRKNGKPEAAIQKQLAGYLRTAAPDLMFFAVPNEREAPVQVRVELIAMGMRPGVSDLVFLWVDAALRLHVGLLEMKAGRNKQSEAQEAFQQHVAALGPLAHYAVAWTFDEALAVLRGWGALG